MAISINFNCCLKPPSPPPPLAPTLRMASKDATGSGLRTRCLSIAAACLVIGCVDAASVAPVVAATEREAVMQWSNKIRKCPPWRENALENVMPENLPRLTDRGRTDGFVSDRGNAPAAAAGDAIRGVSKSCYSL